jgi:hypothetical protein
MDATGYVGGECTSLNGNVYARSAGTTVLYRYSTATTWSRAVGGWVDYRDWHYILSGIAEAEVKQQRKGMKRIYLPIRDNVEPYKSKMYVILKQTPGTPKQYLLTQTISTGNLNAIPIQTHRFRSDLRPLHQEQPSRSWLRFRNSVQ